MNLKEIFNIEQEIDESNILIKEFKYYSDEERDVYNLEVIFKLYINNSNDSIYRKLLFKNVSNFSIKNVYRDKQITGLELINHKEESWQSNIKYEIRDFEEDAIHLLCEKFIVFE